jgi:hypothetical protein
MSPRPLTMLAAACLLAAAPTHGFAQGTSVPAPTTGTAHLIEWDLTGMPDQLDGNPGAIVVDTRGEDSNRVWFITRIGDPASDPTAPTAPQRVYQFDPASSPYGHDAHWSSWELRADIFGGGIKKIRPSHDRRYIFARTTSFIQRVDTQHCTTTGAPTCDRTVFGYPDEQPVSPLALQNSDIAVDDGNRVFTTGVSPTPPFDAGYVQMLTASATATPNPSFGGQLTVNAKRWPVGTGPGTCIGSGPSVLCNSGIDIHPSKQYLVYYTETGTNSIAELNTNITNPTASSPNIRRWTLSDLDPSISEPRTLKVDRHGRVWINTGSGHLVSLDPSTNKMTKHLLPEGASNDLFGIAPDDDVIGYTAAQTNKVGMLFPTFTAVRVLPTIDAVAPVSFPVLVTKEQAPRNSGTAPADAKIVVAKTQSCDGICVEALIDTVLFTTNPAAGPSLSPLGITPNMSKAQGTFFYTVGLTGDAANPSVARRLGFVRLPNKRRVKNGRDDDDTDDGYDRHHQPQWHNSEPGDEDADGVDDRYDTSSSRENTSIFDPSLLPGQQGIDYPLTASSTTLALIASVEADPTAQIAVDIYNALGVLTATSGPMIGTAVCTVPLPAAGSYTARVRNLGFTAVTSTPTFVVRDGIQ